MINETDLRLAFHMDTGNLPMWSQKEWLKKELKNGYPSSEYGRWLEENAGNHRWLQRAFQFENQKAPIYKSKNKHLYKSGFRRYYHYIIQSVYSGDYCYWLEQRILKTKPEVVKDILHI